MLLKPSYLELMTRLNECSDEENKVNSPYAIIVVVAKCARRVNKDKKPVEENRFIHVRNDNNDVKAISVAIKKLLDGKIKIMASTD